jgi:dipeptidase E
MGDSTPTRVLLGSGGIATEERRETYRTLVAEHFRDCDQVLFVPYASHDHSDYTSRMQEFLGPGGPRLVGIESMSDPLNAIQEMHGVYVGGGNSFLLIRALHEKGMVGRIRERVLSGIPYLGVSAGANVASPTMMTTNDMPIALPPSFESFGIVPFQINPHYHPGKIRFMDGSVLTEHYGESRSQRIKEFHRVSDTPVLGMWEGSFLEWDGSRGILTGRATVFRSGEEASLELFDASVIDQGLYRV